MKLNNLEKLRTGLRKYEDTLRYYEQLFKADGHIDEKEQKQLSELTANLKSIFTEIELKEKELSPTERIENAINSNEEAKKDWSTSEDDEVVPELAETASDNSNNSINGSVGQKGDNNKADVQVVQNLLKEKNNAPLKGSGICGPKTIKSIQDFQSKVGESDSGIIEPDDNTWKKLNEASSIAQSKDEEDKKTEDKGILAQVTRYGYITDPRANKNDLEARGNNNNKLTQGLSVALSPELYEQLGMGRKSGDYVSVTFENGSTKKFQTADQTARGLKNLRVDFFDPEGKYKSIDGQKIWVKKASGGGASETVDPNVSNSENPSIQKSVGVGGKNQLEDVKVVQALLKEKGANLQGSGVFGPKTTLAIQNFQKTNLNGFNDGLIDVNGKTWKLLVGNGKNIDTSIGSEDNSTEGSVGKPSWIKIAESQKGVKENKSKSQHHPKVLEYQASVGGIHDDETPWCSTFVNWVMKKAGKGGTNSAVAVSWKNYGKKVENPAYGAIAVIDWDGNGPGWKGHVAFVVGQKGSDLLLLGGNQDDQVKVKPYPKAKVVAYVFPSDYEVPRSAYSLGESADSYGASGDISNSR